ncbi:MAG: class I SAM-dependent methyltransferase [Wenzhouxiangella sp.]|nr:class I SAM-dependent methyltransferase [Wenzhouxiangella sp.]
MSAHFEADWLSLREPVDARARSKELAERLARRWPEENRLRIVDLGAGHGSNQRWLAPRLPQSQHWTLVDHDPQLLAWAEATRLPERVSTQASIANLANWPLPGDPAPDLVTASAFFDLASKALIDRLAAELAEHQCAGLFALSVDGHWACLDAGGSPLQDPETEQLRTLFNRHQQQDKGLGQALGPEAARFLPACLEQAGMVVTQQPSPWLLPAGDDSLVPLARQLLAGWAEAAREQANHEGLAAAWIDGWHRRLLDDLLAGQLGLSVGHVDVLALPA